jgi:hypothetical protein
VHDPSNLARHQRQVAAQRHFMENFNSRHTWAMCLNVDEFVVLKRVRTNVRV